MIDEKTSASEIPKDHIAYAALHRETQTLIKKLQSDLAAHVKDESNAFHDVTEIQDRLGKGDERMTRIEESIEDQRVRGDRIEHDIKGISTNLGENTSLTKELVDIFKTAKGFFTFTGWIATGIKWTVGAVLGMAALYAALRGLDK